ncbi:DNA cytosine methyltransferase [Halomonas sp. ATBC28]|uniref:DNA cytosine methyltransferase n=1 Tax=Halomonas sp. ATBC28 TaxID=2545264 RepID=UPI00110DD647|nr:DNA cytosine methyltransferase [Halomonas sp. ATBC28]TMU20384.1 DNA cytosine methyltransferase [Halomonas sp. ATBC28]
MCLFIQQKIERLRQGQSPRVLDLFAGCGGISLGFQAAGFENIGAVELDPPAAKSHAMNFHTGASDELKQIHTKARDITEIEPADLLQDFGLQGDARSHVDVIVGGPPCQSFARVGRAKLREIAKHPEAFLNDPRGNLYLRYLHYLNELKPLAILMENVPDVLNYGGHNIAEEVCEALRDLGYNARYTMLNAVFYGVPEMRERMFLIAYQDELECSDWFPEPSHWIDLPPGYHGSRQVAMKTVKRNLQDDQKQFFVDPPEPEQSDLSLAVTAEQALSDLPFINDDSPLKLGKATRRFDRADNYSCAPRNRFQQQMRFWEGLGTRETIADHVIRYLPRDYKIFARMQPGDQYPEAFQLATIMFEEELERIKVKEGVELKENMPRYYEVKKAFVPPYDTGKFPNKWRKMEADKPARTLMAHLGKDSYSHIHYDSRQARTISVREAARLQSFPDSFVFQGPMNAAFRQIGNAVPPLMAKALAEQIRSTLTQALNIRRTNIGLAAATAVI